MLPAPEMETNPPRRSVRSENKVMEINSTSQSDASR